MEMADFMLPHRLKKILKKPAPFQEPANEEGEPFPLFQLPELVIDKILKDYIPVIDKKMLSKIPEFKQYLLRQSLWYPSSLNFLKCVGYIQPGWHVNSDNFRYIRYFDVDYVSLSVTMHLFYITKKHTRIPVTKKEKRWHLKDTLLAHYPKYVSNDIFIPLREFLIYECLSLWPTISFWIFKPQQIVYWKQGECFEKGKEPKAIELYHLTQNQCFILDQGVHPHPISLTLKQDLTVVLQCATAKERFCDKLFTVLTPLSFQLCREMGSRKLDNPPTECTSCEKGVNFVHPLLKKTFVNVKRKRVTLIHTFYFDDMKLAADFKKKEFNLLK